MHGLKNFITVQHCASAGTVDMYMWQLVTFSACVSQMQTVCVLRWAVECTNTSRGFTFKICILVHVTGYRVMVIK